MGSSWRIDEGGLALLDRVQPLWEQLREHHLGLNADFARGLREYDFTRRRADFAATAEAGALHVVLVTDGDQDLGYAVSSVVHGEGELTSLFVRATARGRGVGTALMTHTLRWFDQAGARRRSLHVLVGNEQAMAFYERFGFRPHLIEMEQVSRSEEVE